MKAQGSAWRSEYYSEIICLKDFFSEAGGKLFTGCEKTVRLPSNRMANNTSYPSFDSKMYYIYILTNKWTTVLYTGITNDLHRRITEHYFQRGNKKTFCGRYMCHYLVYFEEFTNVLDAIARETEIKKWRREKKIKLIRSENKDFRFLNYTLFDKWPPEKL